MRRLLSVLLFLCMFAASFSPFAEARAKNGSVRHHRAPSSEARAAKKGKHKRGPASEKRSQKRSKKRSKRAPGSVKGKKRGKAGKKYRSGRAKRRH